MEINDFIILGKLSRCNRKTGELTLAFEGPEQEPLPEFGMLFIEIDGGLVPFFISAIRSKSRDNCLVLFEDYSDPEKARQLVGNRVFLSQDQVGELSENQFYPGEIIGYEVIDEMHGSIGLVEQVLENLQQEILQIRFRKKEILIPLVEVIFKKINRRQKKLFINAPDGLIDLYLNE